MRKNTKIHLIGDSLFARHEGYDKPMIEVFLQEKMPNVMIYNSAVAGEATGDVLARMATILSVEVCDYVFVFIGTNDLAINKQVPIPQFKNNILKMMTSLKEQYDSRQIIFLSPTPVDEEKQHYRTNQLITAYGKVIADCCQIENCRFVDLYQLFMDKAKETSLAELLTGVADDGLHFGSVAYSLLADVIIEQL